MKIVIPGGTGQVGTILSRALTGDGHEVAVLSRKPGPHHWDGRTLGAWAGEIDGCDAVINLAGRSVSCRYTAANLKEMMDSRVDSARVVGEAIGLAKRPPKVWLQMSTATIYAHRFDAPNDEATGIIGGTEPGVPGYWGFSVDIAKTWEEAQRNAETPETRQVALRAAMVMSPDRGGVFDVLRTMTRLGLGGPVGGGRQYVSWIHETDFVNAVRHLLHGDLTGPVNLAAPTPLPQRDFMRALCRACGVKIGLPATKWMAEIGALVLRSDTELLLKSRRVTPGRLLGDGFGFEYPEWPDAALDLARRARSSARADHSRTVRRDD
ncbi:TIGR01777 family oxidoreductase [Amycolatopsis sp. NPDC059657]|uniref:TIGR01777 family oxidoreductase n=1 Tax=Amycolatopsis sp. NPDC059657 TaxID=3346899 RepID=UPI00366D0596